jgi:hypothetical protein
MDFLQSLPQPHQSVCQYLLDIPHTEIIGGCLRMFVGGCKQSPRDIDMNVYIDPQIPCHRKRLQTILTILDGYGFFPVREDVCSSGAMFDMIMQEISAHENGRMPVLFALGGMVGTKNGVPTNLYFDIQFANRKSLDEYVRILNFDVNGLILRRRWDHPRRLLFTDLGVLPPLELTVHLDCQILKKDARTLVQQIRNKKASVISVHDEEDDHVDEFAEYNALKRQRLETEEGFQFV